MYNYMVLKWCSVYSCFYHRSLKSHLHRDEMYRLLVSGGILAVVDLDPNILKGDEILNQSGKWAFEATEPHIYNHYNSNMKDNLKKHGFHHVVKIQNDPIAYISRNNMLALDKSVLY